MGVKSRFQLCAIAPLSLKRQVRKGEMQGNKSIQTALTYVFCKLIESVMLPNHLFLCRPLLLLPSSIRVFSSELEKEMATHSSVLAWRIPWKEEPGWLQSKWSQRVR